MFERFTKGARDAIAESREEARRLGSSSVRPEHIFAGLASQPERVAGWVLSQLGLTYDAVREQVASLPPREDRPVRGEIGFSPESKTVLKLALTEARRLGHNYIGTEHLLLALFQTGDPPIPELLQRLGLKMDAVHELIVRELAAPGRSMRRRAGPSLPTLLAGLEGDARSNVVMCRIADPDLGAIDMLVEAGVRSTRSEAAAWLIHAGIEGNTALLERLQTTVSEIRRLREQAQTISREVASGESPPPPSS